MPLGVVPVGAAFPVAVGQEGREDGVIFVVDDARIFFRSSLSSSYVLKGHEPRVGRGLQEEGRRDAAATDLGRSRAHAVPARGDARFEAREQRAGEEDARVRAALRDAAVLRRSVLSIEQNLEAGRARSVEDERDQRRVDMGRDGDAGRVVAPDKPLHVELRRPQDVEGPRGSTFAVLADTRSEGLDGQIEDVGESSEHGRGDSF
mmetsp:Transcript_8465/g.34848  ORF Transcript_8465/g.34848 Transcript_8465/m.34848 type:complete len:205 (+) Transcript_8465:1089-1703(+)